MKKGVLLLVFIMVNYHISASIITVKQDGTGDYTTIQAAVDNIYQTDTILVWPGTYYENVVIDGSCLTLASLSLTTGDPSYRSTTIIDGGQNGSCIVIFPKEQWLKDTYIHGFTLQNGSGFLGDTFSGYTYGGGVYIGNCNYDHDKSCDGHIKKANAITPEFTAHIENCIIQNNKVTRSGGGVYIGWYSEGAISDCIIKSNEATYGGGGGVIGSLFATSRFSNTSITENIAYLGGGLIVGFEGIGIFDSVNRCSIYNNYAANGCDIKIGPCYQTDIYLDTLTVLDAERYFAYFHDNNGYYNDDSVTIDVWHGWLEPVESDIYVDPMNGNDENSGLDFDNALKTINFAYRKIAIDSLEPNTIHLANGTYSDSANNELFPIGLRQFVNLRGETMDGVILDGEYSNMILNGENDCSDYTISKIKFIRGGYRHYLAYTFDPMLKTSISLYRQGENIIIDSIIIENGWCDPDLAHLGAGTGNNFTISNSIFRNNTGGTVLGASGFYTGDTSYIKNCIIANNIADTNQPEPDKQVLYALNLGSSKEAVTIVSNCLIADNENFAFIATSSLHGTSKNKENHFVNCTFANNSKYYGNYAFYMYATSNSFTNCVIYDNSLVTDYIALADWNYTGQTVLNMRNTLIENGEEAIRLEQPDYITLNYDHHTNIDADPVFLGLWDHPYQIADGSPCINTGTLANLPDFIEIPEFDLAGNPRIVGDSIDMGCYEWNPTIVGFNEIGPGSKKEKPKLLAAAPNPFESSTRISIKYQSQQNVSMEVYDNFGRRVKTLLNSSFSKGDYELQWDGTNNNGKNLPKGIYYVIMFSGEKEVESLKVIKK